MNYPPNPDYSPSAIAYDHGKGRAIPVKFALADSVTGFYQKIITIDCCAPKR